MGAYRNLDRSLCIVQLHTEHTGQDARYQRCNTCSLRCGSRLDIYEIYAKSLKDNEFYGDAARILEKFPLPSTSDADQLVYYLDIAECYYKDSNYDKVIVKIEDKKEGQLLKESLNDLNVAIYNGEKKDIEIDENGKIYDKTVKDKTIDVIIATSTIQAGQSLTDNVLQIFIQTPIDTISSVEQFIGRNRLKHSSTHLFLRLIKDKFSIRQSMNRYEYRLNHLRGIAWHDMLISSWQKL